MKPIRDTQILDKGKILHFLMSCFMPKKTIIPLADRCVFRIVIYIYFSRSYCAFAFSWFSLRFRFLDLDCLPIYSSAPCLSTYCWVSLWPFWKVFHHTTINVKYWCTQKAKGGGERWRGKRWKQQLYIDMGPNRGIYYTSLLYCCLSLAKKDCKCPWRSETINSTQELN